MTLPRLDATRYVISMVVGTLIAAALIAAALAVADRPAWWSGFAAAGVSAAASLIVSSAIVLPLFGRETATLASAFLVAGVIRATAFGTIIVIAIKVGGYPQDPTVALGGILYAALVGIEGVALWSMTHATHPTKSLTMQDRA